MRVIILAALLLGGCAAADGLASAMNHEDGDDAKCMSWGVERGSVAYVQCRAALRQERREFFNGLAASNQNTHVPGFTPAPVPQMGTSGQTCMKRSEYISGFNRICNYDCLGSAYAVTYPSSQFCPMSVQR